MSERPVDLANQLRKAVKDGKTEVVFTLLLRSDVKEFVELGDKLNYLRPLRIRVPVRDRDLRSEADSKIAAFYQLKITALHNAALHGLETICRALVTAGASVDVRNSYEETPLHVASMFANNESVCRYLLNAGAEVDARNNVLNTPLHVAASKGNEAVCRALVDGGACTEAVNKAKCTPLHIASQAGHAAVCRYLIAAGAPLGARDQYGKTPLDCAASESVRGMLAEAAREEEFLASEQAERQAMEIAQQAERLLSQLAQEQQQRTFRHEAAAAAARTWERGSADRPPERGSVDRGCVDRWERGQGARLQQRGSIGGGSDRWGGGGGDRGGDRRRGSANGYGHEDETWVNTFSNAGGDGGGRPVRGNGAPTGGAHARGGQDYPSSDHWGSAAIHRRGSYNDGNIGDEGGGNSGQQPRRSRAQKKRSVAGTRMGADYQSADTSADFPQEASPVRRGAGGESNGGGGGGAPLPPRWTASGTGSGGHGSGHGSGSGSDNNIGSGGEDAGEPPAKGGRPAAVAASNERFAPVSPDRSPDGKQRPGSADTADTISDPSSSSDDRDGQTTSKACPASPEPSFLLSPDVTGVASGSPTATKAPPPPLPLPRQPSQPSQQQSSPPHAPPSPKVPAAYCPPSSRRSQSGRPGIDGGSRALDSGVPPPLRPRVSFDARADTWTDLRDFSGCSGTRDTRDATRGGGGPQRPVAGNRASADSRPEPSHPSADLPRAHGRGPPPDAASGRRSGEWGGGPSSALKRNKSVDLGGTTTDGRGPSRSSRDGMPAGGRGYGGDASCRSSGESTIGAQSGSDDNIPPSSPTPGGGFRGPQTRNPPSWRESRDEERKRQSEDRARAMAGIAMEEQRRQSMDELKYMREALELAQRQAREEKAAREAAVQQLQAATAGLGAAAAAAAGNTPAAAEQAQLKLAMADAKREVDQIKGLKDPEERRKRARNARVKYHPDKNLQALRNVFEELSKFVNAETDKLL